MAKVLGCQVSFIQNVLDCPSTYYRQVTVPRKRRPDPRIVYEVNSNLKNLHKNILTSIAAKVDFPECVQGFVSKRSIVTNASLHLGRKYILNLDIKDFFESIKIEKITQVFERLQCSQEVASIFAQLCNFNGCLVQGANTSPILANLVCSDLDEQLIQLGKKYGCSYSRYADDITFSGDDIPKKKEISRCIESYGFKINPDKYKCKSRGQKQYVTGLTVFDNLMPRISKRVKKELRQTLYYINKYGLEDHIEKKKELIEKKKELRETLYDINKYRVEDHIEKSDDQREESELLSWIDGLISFIYSVEPEQAYKFDTAWQAILKKENLKPSRDPSKLIKRLRSQRNLEQKITILSERAIQESEETETVSKEAIFKIL